MEGPGLVGRQYRLSANEIGDNLRVPRVAVLGVRPNALEGQEIIALIEPSGIAQVFALVNLFDGTKANIVSVEDIASFIQVLEPFSRPDLLSNDIYGQVHNLNWQPEENYLGVLECLVQADGVGKRRTFLVLTTMMTYQPCFSTSPSNFRSRSSVGSGGILLFLAIAHPHHGCLLLGSFHHSTHLASFPALP
jgi:hypothetical protein